MCPRLSRQIYKCPRKRCPKSLSNSSGCCSRDVIGTVSITSPINRSHLSPLLPTETVDKLELDCLNYVRVREKIPKHPMCFPLPRPPEAKPIIPVYRKGCIYGTSCSVQGLTGHCDLHGQLECRISGSSQSFPVHNEQHTIGVSITKRLFHLIRLLE